MMLASIAIPRDSVVLTDAIQFWRIRVDARAGLAAAKRQARKQLRLRQNLWTRLQAAGVLAEIRAERADRRKQVAQDRRKAFRVVAPGVIDLSATAAEVDLTDTRVVHVEFRERGGRIRHYDLRVAA